MSKRGKKGERETDRYIERNRSRGKKEAKIQKILKNKKGKLAGNPLVRAPFPLQ